MHSFGRQERKAAIRVLESGRLYRYVPGATESLAFEAELSAWTGSAHAVLVSSGTGALICALAAGGVGSGDEVLIPAYGFVADVLAVLALGAEPVVCEIGDTLTLDLADAERRITSRTRAIVPVHMNGFPAAIDGVLELAARHGLVVVEDACQGFGGTYGGRRLGIIGDLGTYSFNQHKLLTAGEGGAVVTNRRDLYERALITHDGACIYRDHDLRTPPFAGLAFRANELTAAILRAQLRKADAILAGLRKTSIRLDDALAGFRAFEAIPRHDPSGACGTHVAYRFGDPADTQAFLDVASECGVHAGRGLGSGHAFLEWGGVLPGLSLDGDAYPQTADVLARTVVVWCNLGLTDRTVRSFAARLARTLA
ncbi:MAG: DegT/DnrJ/EryC1/StrS family aminotransferase [Acidimicrobiales bacterium]